MASHLVSRFLSGHNSIYETLRQYDQPVNPLYEDDDEDEESRLGIGPSTQAPFERQYKSARRRSRPTEAEEDSEDYDPNEIFLKSPENTSRPNLYEQDGRHAEPDNDVPESLLVEGISHDRNDSLSQDQTRSNRTPNNKEVSVEIENLPPPPSRILDERWALAQNQLAPDQSQQNIKTKQRLGQPGIITPQQRAMYKWANVENLDGFLQEVYDYYLGKGIYCICLSRLVGLMTVAFVIGFSIFMTMCIDYTKIRNSTKLSQIRRDKCIIEMSTTSTFFLWVFCFMWITKLFGYIYDIRRLYDIHQFYYYLLDIPDMDMQTISWQDVVSKFMLLRDSNPVTSLADTNKYVTNHTSKQRMDAHDIANRLMRRENYLIALFNKDILDLTVPLPFLRQHMLVTRTIEWNLGLCILDFVFHDGVNFNPLFLKESQRKFLAQALRTRFLFFGVLNLFLAPFIVLYLVVHYFFQYFNEYQKNPSALGSRQYTPLAEWKFREFNELVHLFHRRMNMSYPYAQRYLDQFPKEKTVQVSRFVAFVTGSFAAVLAIASLIDPELFLSFEISKDRTVLFYIGVFGAIAAVARGMIPADNEVFDPAAELSWVMYHTRYNPGEWKGRLHSDEVKRDFSQMYQMKIVIFVWEVISIILTPFVLWYSLPKSSERIIDFFREFTVHVDGIGYVCSFAEFDFNMAGTRKGNTNNRDEYYDSKDNKMMSSIVGFLENYSGQRQQGVGSRWYQGHHTQGVMSPVQVVETTNGTVRRRGNVAHSQQFGTQSGYRGQSSTLLDRHHQPTASHARTLRQSVYQHAGFNRASSSLREEDEDEEQLRGHYISNLGDSFISTKLDDETDNTTRGYEGGGVLDLLKQFQRAHADSHGRAVGL